MNFNKTFLNFNYNKQDVLARRYESSDTISDMTISKEPTESSKNFNEKSPWKSWSAWSICSRTCDGGATFRYRDCKKHGECVGEKMQYRLCNTQVRNFL